MNETMWIGPQEDLDVGDRGFLIEFSHWTKQSSQYVLRDTPAKTNQSLEPLLRGWCGSYNDMSTNARGFWEVVKMAKNGRAKIKEVEGAALAEALEEFGYPELTPK